MYDNYAHIMNKLWIAYLITLLTLYGMRTLILMTYLLVRKYTLLFVFDWQFNAKGNGDTYISQTME